MPKRFQEDLQCVQEAFIKLAGLLQSRLENNKPQKTIADRSNQMLEN